MLDFPIFYGSNFSCRILHGVSILCILGSNAHIGVVRKKTRYEEQMWNIMTINRHKSNIYKHTHITVSFYHFAGCRSKFNGQRLLYQNAPRPTYKNLSICVARRQDIQRISCSVLESLGVSIVGRRMS